VVDITGQIADLTWRALGSTLVDVYTLAPRQAARCVGKGITIMRKKHVAIAPLTQNATWRERITQTFERMSPGERVIATFLLEHAEQAGFMRGKALAARLSLDPATIVRFAQALGYPGYPALRAEVVADVQEALARAPGFRQPTPGGAAAAWQGGLLDSARAVRDLAGAGKGARRFVARLRGANQVFVVIEASDRGLGALLAHNLRLAGLRAEACNVGAIGAGAIAVLRKGDVALGVSVASKGHVVAGVLRTAAGQGAAALAVAAAASSPAAQAAEVALLCPAEEGLGAVAVAAIAAALRRALSA
jgi:DNA-binding MurR/RpiR family transcriptional regulator